MIPLLRPRRAPAGRLAGFLCVFCLLASPAFADLGSETARRLEEEARAALASSEAAPAALSRPVFDYGGWTQARYLDYRNDDKDASSPDPVDYALWLDTRLWFKAVFRPAVAVERAASPPGEREASPPGERYRYSLYLRLKNLYTDSHPAATAGGSDNDGPHVDYAYAHADLAPWRVRAGRQYFSVGQGIAYSDVDDGVLVFFNAAPWDLRAFWSRTLPHEDNVDTSVPGFDKGGDRRFYGLEADYGGWAGQTLYAFGVWQRDHSEERPADAAQGYRYDSAYAGVGARGVLKKTVAYWWESVHETGRDYLSGTNTRADIDAWAHVAAVSYAPEVRGRPSFYFKAAYASGDADRVSVTDTVNGNTAGKDTNFLYFGYLPTGYAFAPRLSNIYFLKAGASCAPFEKSRRFEKLTVAVDYYKYFKTKAAGGVYDPQATQADTDLGAEIDVTASWGIFSDLFLSLQYGRFMPGGAFPAATDDNEDYLSVSVSLSF
ncbi:MAG: alginate export family protein [Deltaproteobacteria bacterium]